MKYVEFVKDIKDKIKVNFIKVKSHSNNKYNDLADELAKKKADEIAALEAEKAEKATEREAAKAAKEAKEAPKAEEAPAKEDNKEEKAE